VDRGGIKVDMGGTEVGGVGAVPSKNPVGVEESGVIDNGPGEPRPSSTPRLAVAGEVRPAFRLGSWLL